ncbi:MAG: cysteine hydrolase [Burkholderiaceae bacterium]|nr:cysteine hydrolase [Burkholderiaceae bacterium]
MTIASVTRLLIIDPQNDFCDLPETHPPTTPGDRTMTPRPALPVPGADADMRRLAALIDRIGPGLAGIEVSLDSHHPMDIAHPGWWVDEAGRAPDPFTVIGADDLVQGRWRTRDPAVAQRSFDYVRRLREAGRYALVVWPEHCLIGHWGHNLHGAVADSLDRWSRAQGKTVDYLFKGSNPFTEHYSALRAEVPDPADPATLPHAGLLGRLAAADRVLVAGEALSHCVASTVRDLAESLGPAWLRRVVLLGDASSSVAGFEALGQSFVDDIRSRGACTVSCADVIA